MAKYIEILMLSLLIVSAIERIYAKPALYQNGCSSTPAVVETCQRCAKATKSDRVYPMCCRNEEEVYSWCLKYINFGHQYLD